MQPSRPPFPDSNASFRPTTPTLIDFFANENERTEQYESVDAIVQPTPFDELGTRALDLSVASASASTASSLASPFTIQMLRESIPEISGHFGRNHLKDATIHNRLQTANLSVETLVSAIQMLSNPDSPIFATLGISNTECNAILYRLRGIVTYKAGLRDELRKVVRSADDIPEQLIVAILRYVRDPNS